MNHKTRTWRPGLSGNGYRIEISGARKLYQNIRAGTFSISMHDVWIPGIYADRETAIAAFDVANGKLARIQEKINEREPDYDKRVITMADLAADAP